MTGLRRAAVAAATVAVAASAAAWFLILEPAAAVPLARPGQAIVDTALTQPCLDFARKAGADGADPAALPTVPISNGSENAGATLILAVAAGRGDERARRALLRQATHLTNPAKPCAVNELASESSEPTAGSGVSAQHELWATSMFVVMRHTPDVWRRVPTWQQRRIDLIMRATLISNAFATSDTNPFLTPEGQERTIDGGRNVGRDWAPNYREGMIGNVLMGAAYFGDRADDELRTWNRDQFLSDVRRRHMRNLEETFSWGATHPAAGVPSDAQVLAALRNWAYHGVGLAKPMELYAGLTAFTFGLPVSCGANGGQGVPLGAPPGVAGRLADPASCASVPSQGRMGMLREFDTHDGGGVRSSAPYAYFGFKANLATQIGLVASGLWRSGPVSKGGVTTTTLMDLKRVGTTDLFTKLRLGYVSYANGAYVAPPGVQSGAVAQTLAQPGAYGHGYAYTQALWRDVLLRTPRVTRNR